MFHSLSREWLAASALSRSAGPFVAHLRQHQFEAATVQVYVHVIGHFGRWLTEQHLTLSAIDELLVKRFVTEHLPECRCPAPCQRGKPATRAALAHLLKVLRGSGLISTPVLAPSAIHEELENFEAYLDGIAGLAAATRTSRRMWVRKFLLDRFGDGPIRIGRLKPGDVALFLRSSCVAYKPGTCGVLGGALRSYLRFRALQFGDRVDPLSAAIPTVARWRLDTVPNHLTAEEVKRFLEAFDRSSSFGLRGFAMARCLVDLGLRACEVAAFQLDDVNWGEGTIAISGGKSRRVDILPLPDSTGQAIVEYLRKARPRSDSRGLFLRHRAPFRAPITAELVRSAVRRAFAACGLSGRYTGTHVLRHTAAQRMLCAGASLKEVADVLRHRSLDTTTIYTKVNLPRLVAIAAPWPEERQ
jgi:integrase/recombinase XerD